MIALNPLYRSPNSRSYSSRPWNFLGSLGVGPSSLVAGEDLPSLRLVQHVGQRLLALEVTGLSSNDLEVLERSLTDTRNSSPRAAVVVSSHRSDNIRPLVPGVFSVEDGMLRFLPRSPLRPGVTYHLLLSLDSFHAADTSRRNLTLKFTIPFHETSTSQPAVRQVYPTASELPQNLLKFSLYFETPMQRGQAARYLELRDDTGRIIHGAFEGLDEEQWDLDGHRLTVHLNPGLAPEQSGTTDEFQSILEPGNNYRLRVKPGWNDLFGTPLAVGYEKEFSVVPAVVEQVSISDWQLILPATGSRNPLIIRFPQSMDHALLRPMLSLFDPRGRYVDGRIIIGADERVWEFHPSRDWLDDEYALLVDAGLRDIAGNRVKQSLIPTDTPALSTPDASRLRVALFVARPES